MRRVVRSQTLPVKLVIHLVSPVLVIIIVIIMLKMMRVMRMQ